MFDKYDTVYWVFYFILEFLVKVFIVIHLRTNQNIKFLIIIHLTKTQPLCFLHQQPMQQAL